MDITEFMQIVEKIKNDHPFWFDDESDNPAKSDQIKKVEKVLRVKLPHEYIEFIKHYGGGDFAFTNVFSVQPDSEWFILDRNKEIELGEAFIAISDDEAGGYHGFLIDSGVCSREVFYWDHDSKEILKKPQFDDLLWFIIETGLKE